MMSNLRLTEIPNAIGLMASQSVSDFRGMGTLQLDFIFTHLSLNSYALILVCVHTVAPPADYVPPSRFEFESETGWETYS